MPNSRQWSIDITYIPIKRGFLYLTAVIDWRSRCIVGWKVDDTLDTRMVINALKKAFKVAKPQILNSDQGCQFTSQQYIDFVKENGIRQERMNSRVSSVMIVESLWYSLRLPGMVVPSQYFLTVCLDMPSVLTMVRIDIPSL